MEAKLMHVLGAVLLASLLPSSRSMAQEVSKRLSQAEAVADVQQFFSTAQRVHPDLLAKVSLKAYIKLKQQTLDDVAEKLDTDGKISVNDLAYVLSYAAAFFQDGHTKVHWRFQPDDSNTAGKRFPPFLLSYDNGRFVVVASSSKNVEGLEVVSIEGKPIVEFLQPILDRISGETLAYKASCFTGEQAFWYSFSNVCGSGESLTVKVRDAQGKEIEHEVETVSVAGFQQLASDAPDSKVEQLRRQGTHVRFLDSDRIAHFVYPQFNLCEDEKKKVDSVFEQIKAGNARDLIIDLRGNGGGNSAMGDFIFSYLYAEKFCSFSKGRVRLSRDVLSSVAKDWDVPEDADVDGIVVTGHATEESVERPKAFYTGRAFLVVDNGTFSSAAGFAAMFRDYSVGTIIGYETGGLPVCFGDMYPTRLANSGIYCGVSWKQFFGPKPRPGDDEHGVIPDVPMTAELLRAYQDEDDPVLAYTLDYVKKTRSGR